MKQKILTNEMLDNWVNALRSGKYQQAPDLLCNVQNNGHCCLGVFAEVAMGADRGDIEGIGLLTGYLEIKYDGSYDYDTEWDDIALELEATPFNSMNDDWGWDFNKIADFIDANRDLLLRGESRKFRDIATAQYAEEKGVQ